MQRQAMQKVMAIVTSLALLTEPCAAIAAEAGQGASGEAAIERVEGATEAAGEGASEDTAEAAAQEEAEGADREEVEAAAEGATEGAPEAAPQEATSAASAQGADGPKAAEGDQLVPSEEQHVKCLSFIRPGQENGSENCLDLREPLKAGDELGDGWYYASKWADGSNKRVTVTGQANIVIENGADFTFDGGIYVTPGSSLHIWAESENAGIIHCIGRDRGQTGIGGTGKVNRPGASAIIAIHSGTVDARGASHAAGIGSGEKGDGVTVCIEGGKVTAQGGEYAAGIGGGEYMNGGPIQISGGRVEAAGGTDSAGIGGANRGVSGGIDITGGIIKAFGADSAAGIGGGDGEDDFDFGCRRINIGGEDTRVFAFGGDHAAGIGVGEGPWGYSVCNIRISGGDITAIGAAKDVRFDGDELTHYSQGEYGAGIGSGYDVNGGDIMIFAGTVHAVGSYHAAGIGGGCLRCVNHVQIFDDARVTAVAGKEAQAIGAGYAGAWLDNVVLGSPLMVCMGGEPVPADKRNDAYRQDKEPVSICRCEHKDAKIEDKGTRHAMHCPYCDQYKDTALADHTYDEHGVCKQCGHDCTQKVTARPRLDGSIGLDFLFEVPWKDEAKVTFAIGGKEARTVETTDCTTTKDGWSVYSFDLSSIELAEPVTATLTCKGVTTTLTASAADLMKAHMDAFPQGGKDPKPEELREDLHVRSTANLAHYLQQWLSKENGWQVGRDYAGVDCCDEVFQADGGSYGFPSIEEGTEGHVFDKQVEGTGVESVSCRLAFESTTTMRFRITPKQGAGPMSVQATMGDRTYKGKKQADGTYLVEVPSIMAQDFDKEVVIEGSCDGDFRIAGTPLAFIRQRASVTSQTREAYDGLRAAFNYYYAAKLAQEM